MRKEVFRANNVTYTRGGVNLLDNFNLHVFEGEVLGLFFADNQGRDEFVRLVHENHAIEYGSVFFMDELVNSYIVGITGKYTKPVTENLHDMFSNVSSKGKGIDTGYNTENLRSFFLNIFSKKSRTDTQLGVGYISRAGGLIDSMTVAENVFVMRKRFRKYFINKSVLISQFKTFAAEYGIEMDGSKYVRDISGADEYIIHLLKNVLAGYSLIIVRNAGIEYGNPELIKFQQQVRRFAQRGISFIYISGDINVLTSVCDRIAITEGGRVIRNVERSEYSSRKIVRHHYVPDNLRSHSSADAISALRFDGVSAGGTNLLDFSVARGESVLLWDRMDTVRDDVRKILSKEIRPVKGEVRVNGVSFMRANVRISIIGEAPTRSMIFGEMSYLDNLCIRIAERVPKLWLKTSQKEIIREEYRKIVGDCIDMDSPLGLSAAALYDLVYLREYIYNPQILVVEKPFTEMDIKLRMHVMSRIAMFRSRGTTILILDNNTTHNERVSDRILIISGSGISGEKIPMSGSGDR